VTLVLIRAGGKAALHAEGWRIAASDAAEVLEASELLQEARTLEDAARQSAVEAARRARAEGFSEGRREGLEAARQEASAVIADQAAALRLLRADVEARVAGLAVDIVRRLADSDLGSAFLAAAARAAAETLMAETPTAVRVHSDAAAAVAVALKDAWPGLAISIAADVPRDHCVFDTASGAVDASLSIQLDALEAAFARAPEGRTI
jgi:type III secretion protein L